MNNIGYWEKESTKKALMESLNRQKLILSTHVIEYLNSLLELEFSVLKNEIGKEEREVLSDYPVYKRIAMYNIYNRAIKVVNESNIDADITDDRINNRNLEISLPEKYNNYYLFKFLCAERESNDWVKRNLLSKNDPIVIGDITLYKLEENDIAMQIRLNEMRYKVEELRNEVFNRGDPNYSDYVSLNRQTLKQLESGIKLIERRIKEGLSLKDRNAIEIVNMIHKKLLNDYGLCEDDFNIAAINNSTSKTLVRKYPKSTVSDIKHYI